MGTCKNIFWYCTVNCIITYNYFNDYTLVCSVLKYCETEVNINKTKLSKLKFFYGGWGENFEVHVNFGNNGFYLKVWIAL